MPPSTPKYPRVFFGTLLCVLWSIFLSGSTFAQEAPSLQNADFEGGFRTLPPAKESDKGQALGEIAEGWADQSTWAPVTVSYARHEAQPRSGKFAQEVNISRVDSGAVQLAHPVEFKNGVGLRASVWLRGTPGHSVKVLLRKNAPSWAAIASKSVGLSAEWKEVRVLGVPNEDCTGVLMIQTSEPGVFYVDDAKLELISSLASENAPKAGNLISGGSFETDALPFGWSFRAGGYDFMDLTWEDRPLRVVEGGAVGKRSLQYELPAQRGAASCGIGITSPVFTFNGNRPHTASVWLKASRLETEAQVSFEDAEASQSFTVGTEWARYTMTRTLPFLDFTQLKIRLVNRSGEPLTVWVDGAAVEEGSKAAAVWQDAALHAVSLTFDRPGHILHAGESGVARLSISPEPPKGATLALSVEDLLASKTELPALALPAASVKLPELPGRPLGYFKLQATVMNADGKAISPQVELIYARLPKPRELDRPSDSYFGAHIPLNPYYIALARASGLRWIRMHDTCMIGKWPFAEPEPGKWEYYDKQINAAHEAGLAILGMLDGAPARVSATPRNEKGYFSLWQIPNAEGAEEQWRTYVRNVVSHYKGRIDHWEVWNEPWGKWWLKSGGTPELYGQFLKAAYAEAKEANPGATVVGIDTMAGQKWTEQALKVAGTESYDAFSFHDYSDGIVGGPENRSKRQAEEFAAAQNAVGTAKPLWNTEGASGGRFGSWYVPEAPGMLPRTQIAAYVRYDVTQMANGVKAFFLYSIQEGVAMGDTQYRATEHDRAIKPAAAARAVLASLVDGSGIPLRSEPEPGVDVYKFPARKGEEVQVWWAYDGKPHTVKLPASSRVLDAFGSPVKGDEGTITLSGEPVYVIPTVP